MLLHHLSPASFRGVRFLVPSDTAEAGRNAIRHAYPDASYHYLEDNGLHPDEFKVIAVLHGPTLPRQLRALVAALKRPGPGLLKHPYFGSQFVQLDGKYRLQRDDRDAGIIEIEIPFSVTGPARLPGIVSGIPAYVSGIAASALDRLFGSFVARYGNPISAASIGAIASAIDDLGMALESRFSSAGHAGAEIVRRRSRFATDGAALGNVFADAIRSIAFEDSAATPEMLISGFAEVGRVSSAICDVAAAITPDTHDKVRRQECLALLGGHAQAASFLAVAQGMVSRDYQTADDVGADEAMLTSMVDDLQGRDLDGDVHRSILEVYVATSEVLAEVAVRRPRLAIITVHPVPASVLAYSLSESDGMAATIVSLNPDQPPVLLAGDVAVLMSV